MQGWLVGVPIDRSGWPIDHRMAAVGASVLSPAQSLRPAKPTSAAEPDSLPYRTADGHTTRRPLVLRSVHEARRCLIERM
jgi:hypothetical protein